MDIAGVSMNLSQMKIAQESSMAVMKMAMDAGKNQIDPLVDMANETTKTMEHSVTPHLGGTIDIQL